MVLIKKRESKKEGSVPETRDGKKGVLANIRQSAALSSFAILTIQLRPISVNDGGIMQSSTESC